MSKSSIIREIQQDLVEETASVTAVLRKARLAARKLGLDDFHRWIVLESDGYSDVANSDLPKYRHVSLIPNFLIRIEDGVR